MKNRVTNYVRADDRKPVAALPPEPTQTQALGPFPFSVEELAEQGDFLDRTKKVLAEYLTEQFASDSPSIEGELAALQLEHQAWQRSDISQEILAAKLSERRGERVQQYRIARTFRRIRDQLTPRLQDDGFTDSEVGVVLSLFYGPDPRIEG